VSIVRPFPALVVRPEWARRLVSGLAELPEDTGTLPRVAPPDPAAYDEAGAALYVYRQGDHVGVVCEVDVRAFVDGRARGHEAVQAQRVESLVKHMETDAAPALVALLHEAGPVYAETVAALCATDPLLDFAGPGSLRQQVRAQHGLRPSSDERPGHVATADEADHDWLKKPFSMSRARSSAEISTLRGVSMNTLSAIRCMPPSRA